MNALDATRNFARRLGVLAIDDADPAVVSEIALRVYELERARDEARAEILALSVRLLMSQRDRGHSCIELGEWAERDLTPASVRAEGGRLERLPPIDGWREALLASPLVTADDGDPTAPAPSVLLILDEEDRLYLRRDLQAERWVARDLAMRLGEPRLGADLHEPASDVDRAIEAVRGSRLTVITGGPGTGKTTAVASVLRRLLDEDSSLAIALAAPTGKAATRLAESLGEDLTIPVLTLHRLLGLRPGRIDPDPPRLPYDVVVVDEASMVGLHLMLELLRRLDAETRLVLVGDARQLASVEAGSVLADLQAFASERRAPAVVRSRFVEFQHNWRFDAQPGISALADAIRSGAADLAIDALSRGGADLVHHEFATGIRELSIAAAGAWQRAAQAKDATQATQVLQETRVLCALREGPVGVRGLTRRISDRLRAVGARVDQLDYEGRPILITENSRELGLSNGDVGVVWKVGELSVVFFDQSGGSLRQVPLSQLPTHEDAWAMTIHKSQGSEFDEVWLVLPPEAHPLATRDLIYTGVTRARRRLHVVGSMQVLRDCVERADCRRSGLSERMRKAMA